MRLSPWLLPILVAVTAAAGGCKKKKGPIDAPPPSPPIDAKDTSTGAGPGPREVVPVGEPFSAEPDGAAGEPGLAVDRDGKALLAWIEKGRVRVRRWSGQAWDPVGLPPNDATHRASGKPSLAVEESGDVVVAWQEMNKQDVNVLRAARWKDGAWAALPELGSGTQAVMDPIVEPSPVGLVAVWREADAAGKDVVHVRAYDEAKGWQPLGAGVLRVVEGGTTRRAPALATSKAGVLVGWIERAPSDVLHLRRWDAGASTWVEVPAPEGVDGDSTLAVALAPDGTITVALSYTIGLRQVVTLAPGATEWTKIDVPEVSNGYASGQRLRSTTDGRTIFTYSFGGRFAWWDGTDWTATPVGVMAPSTIVPVTAAGENGAVFVGWSAGPANAPAKVRVVEVKKHPAGAKP